jgi:mannitol/fructose-specific phosphotransferase system IIA component (Ntr-type)
MPYRVLNIEEVGRYLHLNRVEVERLVKSQDIPFERHGQRLVFRKVEIDAWASPLILGLHGRRLAEYHQKTSRDIQQIIPREALMPELIRPDFIDERLRAKTKASVLREMAALAEKTGRVWDSGGLLNGLQAREQLCSTGLPGGLALLHTRDPESYLFESLFVVLGRTIHSVPFGAPDGQPTDLFFLVACPDDRLYLHILARFCLMAQETDLLAMLREAPNRQAMYGCLLVAEKEALASRPCRTK